MLITCPECELQVSDKALTCPHCGYPISGKAQRKISKKHMRLPNGFGQITEIKGKPLRNPYRVMITVGKTEFGRPISKLLKPNAYFKTYNEAYEALVEYHKNPYELDSFITMDELYEEWSKVYFEGITEASTRTVKAAWAKCDSIKNIIAKTIKPVQLKSCIDGIESPNIKARAKSVLNLMFDYALEHEILAVNPARAFKLSNDVTVEVERLKKDHISFSEADMKKLWENITIPYVPMVLIQCYTGFRPQELGLIRTENVDLKRNIIVGGMKTKAGTNRIVPIHSRIRSLVKSYYDEAVANNREYLLSTFDQNTHLGNFRLTYDKYAKRFDNICKQLELEPDHRPHDPRKHFVTMAKKYKVDEYAIKRIVGHAIGDITEKIYTDRPVEWLNEEIEKIK